MRACASPRDETLPDLQRASDLGFTGSRDGMTPSQAISVGWCIAVTKPDTARHGDCIGADERFHKIVREVRPDARIVIHPPLLKINRAFCSGNEARTPKGYLDRNADITDECDALLAAPGQMTEQIRSGTWSTIRKARAAGKRHIIVYPDGHIVEHAAREPDTRGEANPNSPTLSKAGA